MSCAPYTFQLLFRGLCAIVPSKPIDHEPRPQHVDWITVLVPNLLISRKLRKREILSSHYPCIEFTLKQRDEEQSDRLPDLIVPGDTDTGLCFLDGEDLYFKGLGAQSGLDLDNRKPSDPVTPKHGEETSLFWLAKLEKAKKRAGVLKKGLVRPASPEAKEILGRLVMDRGKFSTNNVTKQVATFDDFSNYHQTLAWELLWEVEGVTEAVEIDFKFISPTGGKSTKLVLAPHQKGEMVTLTLRNLEIEAFIEKYQGSRGRRGKDFEIHYGLSKASGGRHPVPVLPAPPLPPDSVHELCPPTLFQTVQQ